LPGSGTEPLAAVEERVRAGIDRVALPIPAFMPDLEASIAKFGERVIAQASDD
jgi:hypothetical protein